jgi:hypothetical protein
VISGLLEDFDALFSERGRMRACAMRARLCGR